VSGRGCLALVALAGGLLALAACGESTGGSELGGSVSGSYDLDYDRVEVKKQFLGSTLEAVLVLYAKDTTKAGTPYYPVKLVVLPPVPVGQFKSLMNNAGTVTRVMPDSSQFPSMKDGKVKFDSLGEPGSNASGEFFITFADASGNTLRGTFSATVEKLTAGK
jgi:hypothetical protein